MPKMKTNAAAKKRFSFTGTGKIKRKHAYHSHILTKKSTKEPAGEIIRPEFALFINTERISPEERERITSLTALSKTFKYATFSQRCCVTRKEKKSFETCQG